MPIVKIYTLVYTKYYSCVCVCVDFPKCRNHILDTVTFIFLSRTFITSYHKDESFWQSLSTKHRTKSLTRETGNYPVACFVSRPSGITLVKLRSLQVTIKTNIWQSLSTKHRTKYLTHQTGNYPVTIIVVVIGYIIPLSCNLCYVG